MILKLKGDNGRTIYEVDTNQVVRYTLPQTGDVHVILTGGKSIIIDRAEHDKLDDAMNADR